MKYRKERGAGDRVPSQMEKIRLELKGESFVEFKGKMLFSYRENWNTQITLYRTAEGEAGEYALYVQSPDDGNTFYCFGNNEDGILTPMLDSIPVQETK